MYIVKEPNIIKFLFGDNKRISEQIGINNAVLCRILKGKQATKYTTAFCIVKTYDAEKEVLDYFKKID